MKDLIYDGRQYTSSDGKKFFNKEEAYEYQTVIDLAPHFDDIEAIDEWGVFIVDYDTFMQWAKEHKEFLTKVVEYL